MAVRTAYLAARRLYRQPAPETLSLTLSAFTETAYWVGRVRMSAWPPTVLDESRNGRLPGPREDINVTWSTTAAAALDDDWDDLTETLLHDQAGRRNAGPRPRVRKVDVARAGILDGLTDWRDWYRSCPNDPRRRRPLGY